MGSKKEFITMNKKEADEEGGIKVKTEKRAKTPFLQKEKFTYWQQQLQQISLIHISGSFHIILPDEELQYRIQVLTLGFET